MATKKVIPIKPLKSWSFSRYSTYKQCPLKAKFSLIDKIAEPKNQAMERGAQIHELAGDLDEAAVELLTAGLEERQNNQLRVQAGLAPQPLSIEDAQLEQVIKSIPKSIAALIFSKKEAQE